MPYHLDILLERPFAQRALLVAALVLMLAALDYATVYRHQAGAIARAAADLELVRLQEARLRSQLSRIPQLRDQAAALRRELHARLPRRAGPSTLKSVSARAAAVGLDVTRFKPGAARREEHYVETPINVELKGTFRNLLRFLALSEESGGGLNAAGLEVEALPPEDRHTRLRIALELALLRVPREKPGTAGEESPVAEPNAHAVLARIDTRLPHRDPFQPYEPPAPPEPDVVPAPAPAPEPVSEPRFQAAGIVWQKHMPVALVKDAEGFGHVVQPGAPLGDRRYRVKAITPCAVVLETLHEETTLGETRLRLPRCGAPDDTEEPRPGRYR